MIARRQDKYPRDLDSLASCHPSFSEAENVDRAFMGRTVEEIPIGRVEQCIDAPFLAPRAMAYFWPRVLQAMFRRPRSRLARNVIFLTLRAWINPSRPGPLFLSHEDLSDSAAILERILVDIEDPRLKAVVESFIDLYR